MGGLARKATILDKLEDEGKHLVVVDAGDLFFKNDVIDPGITTDTAKINAEIILESFNKMGCDAFSPGSKDFAGGFDFLLKMHRKADFPFISSNIADSNNELLFEPYTIKKINGNKIGIIGLSSVFSLSDNSVNVLDPFQLLDDIIYDVESKSDIVVLLFNATDADIKKIYTYNYPIDVILRSKGRNRSSDGGSKIPTYSAGNKGKILYEINLNYLDEEYSFIDLDWCNNTVTRIEDRLNKMKRGDITIDLKQLYKDDKATLNRIDNYERQLHVANQKYTNALNTVTLTKIELGKTIFDRTDILKIVDRGKLEIKDIVGPQLPGPSLGPLPVVPK